ncbi:MAG: endolytic transglycosylase MltG [Patescibacteria group bacterium]
MSKKQRWFFGVLAGLIILWGALFAPPVSSPADQLITLTAGQSVTEVSLDLAETKIIKWPFIFRLAIFFTSRQNLVVAGDYHFSQPVNVWRVAWRLARGEYDLTSIKVTLPEGVAVKEMAEILTAALPKFDTATFTAAALPLEGRLFPDTYFFQPTVTAAEVIKRLQTNFQEKIEPLAPMLAESGRTLEQIIIMASLVEKEAATPATRQTIAGILWKRLDTGMPLQVDAVFPYIIDKNTFEVNRRDLATSSPYNTYRFRGLPEGPITNPGLAAITAVLNPIETDYWYYLSDYSGQIHYAADFDAHRANKARYLP